MKKLGNLFTSAVCLKQVGRKSSVPLSYSNTFDQCYLKDLDQIVTYGLPGSRVADFRGLWGCIR